MRRRFQLWSDPSFWRWWWREEVGRGEKALLAVIFATLVGFAGYASATTLADPAETEAQVVTVKRTVVETLAGGSGTSPRLTPPTTANGTTVGPVQRRVVTVELPGGERVVTTTRNQRVIVTTPGSTVVRSVTVQGAVRERVVTAGRTLTETQAQTVDRPVTVTNESTRNVTVSGPTRTVASTVTGPTQTVTRTVTSTVTGPTQTVTRTVTSTVTGPTQTVTRTETRSVTTVETVTVTAPSVTITVRRP